MTDAIFRTCKVSWHLPIIPIPKCINSEYLAFCLMSKLHWIHVMYYFSCQNQAIQGSCIIAVFQSFSHQHKNLAFCMFKNQNEPIQNRNCREMIEK